MDAAVDWVPEVTREAMVRLLDHAQKVALTNTEEFTFRALFMAAAHDLLDLPAFRVPDVLRGARETAGASAAPATHDLLDLPTFQTEWKSHDLLVRLDDSATVVEFKYYLRRPAFGLDGKLLGYKGGPSSKNEDEFRRCVDKLRAANLSGMVDRRLVLLYGRADEQQFGRSFHVSYGGLGVDNDFSDVQSVSIPPLEARVLRIRPANPVRSTDRGPRRV